MKKFSWIKKPINEELYSTIRESFDYSDDFCKLLATRGFQNIDEVKKYLMGGSDLSGCSSASAVSQLQIATDKIFETIKKNSWIVIHGDYDVDGISATTILFDFIYYKLNYKNVIPYIPSRLDEGYGISEGSLVSILELVKSKVSPNNSRTPFDTPRKDPLVAPSSPGRLKGESAKEGLVISVDCGVKETSLIDDKWCEVFDFIITDHHSLKIENDEIQISQKAIAVIHPKILNLDFQEICGTVMIYKLIEFIIDKESLGPKIKDEYFPFLALATNCDVMPLVGENREILKKGLKLFKDQLNPGLKSLVKITKLENLEITPYHLGYVLGPHINAAGRIGNALDAVKLFVSRDQDLTDSLAQKLSTLNSTRQTITLQRMAIAEADAERQVENGNKIVVIIGDKWEDGIIGLIAGKLCEKYHLPTIVISVGEEEAVGSCRSLANINITEILGDHSKLLLRFGGHTQAAGLRLNLENVDNFKNKITKYCNSKLNLEDLQKKILIDLQVSNESICEEFFEELMLLEPHGMGNAKPNLLFSNCTVENCFPLGKEGKHLKIHISRDDIDVTVVGFNVDEKLFALKSGCVLDIVGNLDINEYNGQRNLQIILKDLQCL